MKCRSKADQDLMRRVARHEDAAVRELMDRFAAMVGCMAYKAGHDTEDIKQLVWIKLIKTAGMYDLRLSALVTWVRLITSRVILDQHRRRQVREFVRECLDPTPFVGPPTLRDEERSALMRTLDRLPPKWRETLSLIYLRGLHIRQAAAVIGEPIGTTKSRLSRALDRLRSDKELAREAA